MKTPSTTRSVASGRQLSRVVVAFAFAIAVSLSILCGSASAALTHATVEKTFPTGCNVADDIAVVESTELIYAACGHSYDQEIRRFDFNGNPVSFTANEPYVSGNAIIADPNPLERSGNFDSNVRLDVANSVANDGYIFVSGGPATWSGESVEVFAPSGKWITGLSQLPNETAEAVGVGPDGSVYAIFNNHISKYSTDFQEVRRLLIGIRGLGTSGAVVRADSTGAVWVVKSDPLEDELLKYESDQFTTNLNTRPTEAEALGLTPAAPSPFAPNRLVPSSFFVSSLMKYDVDPTNDDVYVNYRDRIAPYSRGDAVESAHQDGPTFGLGVLDGTYGGIAVTADGHIYVAKGSSIVVFAPGEIVPDIVTPTPQVDEIGHTSAALHAIVKRAGGPPITECVIEYGAGSAPCTADAGASFSDASIPVTGTISGLTTGATYHYKIKAGNANGSNLGGDHTVTPAAVLKLHTLAADAVDRHGATLHASLDPDGYSTTYRFEYGLDTTYGQITGNAVVTGSGVTPVAAPIANLPSGRTFHYRVAATNSLGTTYGQDLTFRTASPPDVAGLRATDISADSAVLHARIDPVGYDTSYRFEYGTTPSYGGSVPVPDEDIGSTGTTQSVAQQIVGLQPGVTYHFRVVATNEWGTSASDDTTFDYSPPVCPNAHVRQETRSNYLPDCRAYELVSPGNAGSVGLFPWEEFPEFEKFFGVPPIWPVNRGLATNPPRFAYLGGGGSVAGVNAPNGAFDTYMATRTDSGWVTTMPGMSGSEAMILLENECSDDLGRCIVHNYGDVVGGFGLIHTPFLFTAEGERLGQLPTNVAVIPGGEGFTGDQKLAGDGTHFAFSSNDVRFAPEGIDGAPGSAYVNDFDMQTVEVVSRLNDGSPIPQEVSSSSEFLKFPGLSTDGSHVLMQLRSDDSLTSSLDAVHLYMRVGGAVTYDVTRGAGATYAGMTADGSRVYFVTDKQLTADDTDSSADLYAWSEAGDSLVRVSQGAGQGDTDGCNPTWVSKCGAAMLTTEHGHPYGTPSIPGTDDLVARESGDIFFYSPELLDPSAPGILNQRNLYVYRDGSVRLVATLDPGTTIKRIQISPDGAHAAFLSPSRLTGYDNKGFVEMYTYNADADAIRCASCRPDGLPPTGNVLASGGGPFMANDGRTFFTTPDALVSRDSNDRVFDVYEYVDGRPQLITSGTSSRDFTGGGEVISIFPGSRVGLESVSADGRDVFFSTFDSLVPQDENGPFVKFYDARVGGGFEAREDIAPCAAADECHGPGTSAPAPLVISSSGRLGATGNLTRTRRGKAKHRRKHRTHRNRSRRAGHRR